MADDVQGAPFGAPCSFEAFVFGLLRRYWVYDRSLVLAARNRCRYVPSNTVSVSDVQVDSYASVGRLL